MSTDLTFITNEKNRNLLDRFKVLIKDTEYFDVLVGYFFTSGFYALYKSLEPTKRVRILIGISTNSETIHFIKKYRQQTLQFSHAEVKEGFSNNVITEMENSEDSRKIEEGINKFLEWLISGKLEIKAYPSQDIHAKLYVMSFREGDRDRGRVITGSSNFTKAGLVDNLEFNVELKNRADYDYAKNKFEELWADAVDVSDKYRETILTKTWLNSEIKPYELYLKFLYEYFKDEISQQEDVFFKYRPTDFKKLEYQEQAVLNAKKILDEYGGVFISDVVGLGKTYISAMLANQIDGRHLVIAPPVLLEQNNPGSWKNVFSDFRVAADFESLGKLDYILKRGVDKYKNIFIDEAHRFRTETNVTYEKLAQICRGKRIILVTATPYNNTPKDILSQIKLFQKVRKSTIPNLPDLEAFFSKMDKKLKGLDRLKDRDQYLQVSKDTARNIRDKVLKYLMVRRTRGEVEKYFKDDIEKQGLKFPKVSDPKPVYYELNEKEDKAFTETIKLIAQKIKYTRYMPLLYYKGDISQPEQIGQMNMGKLMKILLIKRLESSFYAFKKSIDRFIYSNERFLEEFEKGNVYVSKEYSNKIYDLLENDNDEVVQRLIDEDKAEKYPAKDFKKEFKEDLGNDIKMLNKIKLLWKEIERDPKIEEFKKIIASSSVLKKNKFIVFTESKETAEYLKNNLKDLLPALLFTGGSSRKIREEVIENFDANAKFPKDNYHILISTEVLSEGVNLHRSNIVVNYDIPWNPTRLMQRVGRINRIDTKFTNIYTYNFFPTLQANTEIKLKEAAESKIHAFITMLGSDARLLTDGEPIGSHELFNKLISKKTIIGDEEIESSELKYLNIIRNLRDNDPDLFNKIKRLPKKARTARKLQTESNQLITYFKKGKLQKFYKTKLEEEAKELDFISAAQLMEVKVSEKKERIGIDFYDMLEKNKKEFEFATMEDIPETKLKGGRDSATQIVKILRAIKDLRKYTEDQELYLQRVIRQIEEGGLPKQTTKIVNKELNENTKTGVNPLKIIAILQKNIPQELLESHYSESVAHSYGPNEVILSEYLIAE